MNVVIVHSWSLKEKKWEGSFSLGQDLTPVTQVTVNFFCYFVKGGLRSKCFRGVGEQRKNEGRDFRCFARAVPVFH